jgi:hypothetical protein
MAACRSAPSLGKSHTWVNHQLKWLKELKVESGTFHPKKKTPFSGQGPKKRRAAVKPQPMPGDIGPMFDPAPAPARDPAKEAELIGCAEGWAHNLSTGVNDPGTDELREKCRALEIEAIGLRSEIEELKSVSRPTQDESDLRSQCSFCCRSAEELSFLVRSPHRENTFICCRCIEQCAEVVASVDPSNWQSAGEAADRVVKQLEGPA